MRTCVKTIKFTAIASILLLILTYLVSVNVETHYIELKTAWLSNGFLLTLFGGAFASMLVVLLCEIHRYSVEKRIIEGAMFYNALYLYDELYLLKMNLYDFQNAPDKTIHEKLAESRAIQIQNTAAVLERTEYFTLCRKSRLFQKHSAFIAGLDEVIRPVVLGSNFLEQSVLLVKIENLKNRNEKPVTSSDYPVFEVLTAEQERIAAALTVVDSYLTAIDSACNKRYKWGERQLKAHASYVSIFDAAKLDDFIKSNRKE